MAAADQTLMNSSSSCSRFSLSSSEMRQLCHYKQVLGQVEGAEFVKATRLQRNRAGLLHNPTELEHLSRPELLGSYFYV